MKRMKKKQTLVVPTKIIYLINSMMVVINKKNKNEGSCLKTGQHLIFVIIYLLLPIKCIFLDSVSKILFKLYKSIIIIIFLIMKKILLHYVYKIITK